jgi:hypothetical protein
MFRRSCRAGDDDVEEGLGVYDDGVKIQQGQRSQEGIESHMKHCS